MAWPQSMIERYKFWQEKYNELYEQFYFDTSPNKNKIKNIVIMAVKDATTSD